MLNGLPDSIRVVQLILVQLVLVRIQVRQHPKNNPLNFGGLFFFQDIATQL